MPLMLSQYFLQFPRRQGSFLAMGLHKRPIATWDTKTLLPCLQMKPEEFTFLRARILNVSKSNGCFLKHTASNRFYSPLFSANFPSFYSHVDYEQHTGPRSDPHETPHPYWCLDAMSVTSGVMTTVRHKSQAVSLDGKLRGRG